MWGISSLKNPTTPELPGGPRWATGTVITRHLLPVKVPSCSAINITRFYYTEESMDFNLSSTGVISFSFSGIMAAPKHALLPNVDLEALHSTHHTKPEQHRHRMKVPAFLYRLLYPMVTSHSSHPRQR